MFTVLELNSSTSILAALLSIYFVSLFNLQLRFRSNRESLMDIKKMHSLFRVDAISLEPNLVARVTTYNTSSNPEVPTDPNCTSDACGL